MKAKIPRAFYDDRVQRDLPCPAVLRTMRSHYVIPLDTPFSKDFLDDAEHYADQDGPTEISVGLKSSARATVRAIKRAMQ